MKSYGQRHNFNCTRSERGRLSSLCIFSLFYKNFSVVLWFTFKQNWFSLMFSYTFLSSAAVYILYSFLKPLHCLCARKPRSLFEDNIIQKHFSFFWIINIARNVSSFLSFRQNKWTSGWVNEKGREMETFVTFKKRSFFCSLLSLYVFPPISLTSLVFYIRNIKLCERPALLWHVI